MPVRAADQVTLQTLASPTYVRTYFLVQESTLSAPAAPTSNPPASPWTTIEPGYTAGATTTLYTVQLVAYGPDVFEYGPVQKSSAYEAAKQAYNAAVAAQGTATTALTTANGKNKIIRSTADASVPANYVANDQWWKYSGTQIVAMWLHTGTAWQIQTLTDAVITNLSAATITAGVLAADRIGAATISASKLILGDTTNMILDPDFSDSKSWQVAATRVITAKTDSLVPTGAPVVSRVLRIAAATNNNDAAYITGNFGNRIPVNPGDVFAISYWVARTADANSSFRMFLTTVDAAGANPSWPAGPVQTPANTAANTWVQVTGIITIPNGKYGAAITFGTTSAGTPPAGSWFIGSPTIRKAMQGQLIVDGSITTAKVAAGAITAEEIAAETITANLIAAGAIRANHISPEAGASLDISTNGSINMITGRQSLLEDDLGLTNEALRGVEQTVSEVAEGVGAAQGAAETAAELAAGAVAQVAEVGTALTELGNVYRFTPTAAIIGNPGTNSEVRISSSEIGIYIASNRVSWWNAGQFNATSLVAIEAQLGNHKIEKIGNRTVFRKV